MWILKSFDEMSQMKRQMELAGTNLSDDELENMLEEGGRAKLLGHVQVPSNILAKIFLKSYITSVLNPIWPIVYFGQFC
jgi:hypothetical protein